MCTRRLSVFWDSASKLIEKKMRWFGFYLRTSSRLRLSNMPHWCDLDTMGSFSSGRRDVVCDVDLSLEVSLALAVVSCGALMSGSFDCFLLWPLTSVWPWRTFLVRLRWLEGSLAASWVAAVATVGFEVLCTDRIESSTFTRDSRIFTFPILGSLIRDRFRGCGQNINFDTTYDRFVKWKYMYMYICRRGAVLKWECD